MKTFQFIFLPVFVLLFNSAFSNSTVIYPKELVQLHENVLSYILEEKGNSDSVENWLSDLKEDGSWPDVIYDDKVDGPWRTKKHLDKLLTIAKIYQNKGNKYYHNKEVLGKIHLALDYWLKNNFLSPYAWWYNEIGTPGTLAQILILMEDELSEKQIELGVRILNRAKIKYTGENRVWVSGITLFKSLLRKDIDSLRIASKSIQGELAVRLSEGIQPDWSFHQHGPQLQLGNYGLSFIGDMIKWIQILRNSPYAFDENKIAILRNYLLEGLQWATWKGRFDIPACGRKLEADSPTEKANTLSGIFEMMIKLDPSYAGEYEKALNWQNLEGDKHFWRSEYQVKRTPEYFFSVKMVSKRVKGAESSRYENVNGYHMGDGVTFIYTRGDEYENIFPYWDWKKIPGATIGQDDKKLPLLLAVGYFTDNEFVGGVSDGDDGIAVMDFERDGLSAKKSWFMFQDMIVCLGAGISSSENVPVTTSVNQCFCKDVPFIKTKFGTHLASEEENITDPAWIIHDSVGYLFPQKGNVKLETKLVEGSWYRYATYLQDEKIYSRIFKLWFNHGINPSNETYCYILIPNASKGLMEKIEKKNQFVINNTSTLQEVTAADGNLAGVVFYKPCKSNSFGGIEANVPCIVMLKKEKEGIHLSVSDPTQKLDEILIKIAGDYQSDISSQKNGQTVLKIKLPKGGDAGKTVSVLLKKL